MLVFTVSCGVTYRNDREERRKKDERWEETGREIRKKGGGEKQPASCIDKRPFEISLEKLLGVRC